MSVAEQIRSGAWLTAARMRAYGTLMLALAVAGMLAWIALSKGGIDPNGKPLGTDFSSFYAAGRLALAGHAESAYDGARHYAEQQRLFGPMTPYYAWFYPPIFLLMAALLALLPYAPALIIWQCSSLGLYLAAMAAILQQIDISPTARRTGLLLSLAFPAVFINLGHGQNGALTAALFALALLSLRQYPLRAGVLFALLAYKPQFVLAIPIVLLAARQWRCLAAAMASGLALLAIASAVFGSGIWALFLVISAHSRVMLLEQNAVGYDKMQSAFALIQLWGGGVPLAYAVQALVSVVALGAAAFAWHISRDIALRSCALLLASLLAAPLVLDYDLMLLGPAIAFLAAAGLRGGFRPYEISLLATAWLVPLLARLFAGIGLPLGWPVIAALFVLTLRRIAADRRPVTAPAAPLAPA